MIMMMMIILGPSGKSLGYGLRGYWRSRRCRGFGGGGFTRGSTLDAERVSVRPTESAWVWGADILGRDGEISEEGADRAGLKCVYYLLVDIDIVLLGRNVGVTTRAGS